MHSRLRLALTLVVALSAARIADAITYRTVALNATPAPGVAPVDMFTSFGVPALNAAGQTAFQARLSDPDTAYDGIWSEGSGSLSPVALAFTNAPGTSAGVQFGEFGAPNLNDAGRTAFHAYLFGTGIEFGVNNVGIWSEGSGALNLVARATSPAPGTDRLFYGFSYPKLNNAGQTAFWGSLGGPGGIWSEGGGALHAIAFEGAQAPDGLGPYFNFSGLPAVNDAGQTAFTASLWGGGGVWSEGGGSLHAVALENWAAPGTDAEFSLFVYNPGSPGFNNAGQTAFQAIIKGANVDGLNDAGIWSETGGSLHLVVRESLSAPGLEPGTTFRALGGTAELNNTGQTLFWAELGGPNVDDFNKGSVWVERSGGLHLVAREGSAAPGAGPGVTFKSIQAPFLNDAGHVPLVAYLSGPDVDSTNDVGIWVDGPLGLEMVARTGSLFEVSAGDYRTISGLRFAGTDPESATARGFNNQGQLAFLASFTDGSSGIFVASSVPEPASSVLCLMALAWLPRRRFSPNA